MKQKTCMTRPLFFWRWPMLIRPHKQALPLAMETFAFLDSHLADKNGKGYFETPANNRP